MFENPRGRARQCRRPYASWILLFVLPALGWGSEIVVAAPRLSLTAPSAEEARKALHRVPGGASLLDSTELSGRTETLKDALDMVPGVFLQPRQGSMTSRFSMRGSGVKEVFHLRGIRLLQDGVTLGAADGEGDVEELDLDSMAYAEVYRGANALALGAATLGGAVNFISRSGLDEPAGTGGIQAGSWGTLGAGLSAAFRAQDLDARFSYGQSSREGFQDYSREDDQKFSAQVGWLAAPGLETRLTLGLASGHGQLPGSITKPQLYANPRQAEPKHVAGKWHHDFQSLRVSDRTVWKQAGQSFDASFFYARKFMDHPVTVYLQQSSDNAGLAGGWQREDSPGGRSSRFQAGFDVLAGRIQDDRFRNLSGTAGARTGQAFLDAATFTAYFQEQFEIFPGLFASTGAQGLGTVRNYVDRYAADGDQSAGIYYRSFNPKAGLMWEADPTLQVFANFSRSFEPPSFSELASSNYVDSPSSFFYSKAPFLYLNPQSASTWELGSRGSLSFFQWDAAAYVSRVENELLTYHTAPGVSSTGNAPATLHRGLEAGLTLTPWPGLKWRQNYVLSCLNFQDDPLWGGNQIPGIPLHSFRSELEYKAPSGIYMSPGLEWVPSGYPVDMANQLQTDPYVIWGLKAGWEMSSGLSLYIQGTNLGDQIYAATTGIITRQGLPGVSLTQFNPGDGRSWDAGAEITW